MLALAALLLAATPLAAGPPAAAPDTTLHRAAFGDWTLAAPFVERFPDASGDTVTVTTQAEHLTVSADSLRSTWVAEQAFGRSAYRIAVPLVVTPTGWALGGDGNARVEVAVDGDTLRLTGARPDGRRETRVYARAAPARVPPGLVGTWLGQVVDPAGVPVDIVLRIRPEGVVESNIEDTGPLHVLGGYLVWGRAERVSGPMRGTLDVVARADPYRLDGDRLALEVEDGPLELVRAPPGE